MLLKRLNYRQEWPGKNDWSLKNIEFQDISLVVAKNSTGKSRLLNVISSLAGYLAGERRVPDVGHGRFEVEFLDGDRLLEMTFEHRSGAVVSEQLTVGDRQLLTRGPDGNGSIVYEGLEGKSVPFQLAKEDIALDAKRDQLQHPFLDPLFRWGRSLRHYRFGTDLGQSTVDERTEDNKPSSRFPLKNPAFVVRALKKGIEKAATGFKDVILDDINGIGYQLTDIGVEEASLNAPKIPGSRFERIFIKERGLPTNIQQTDISQGLFRALSLLIHLRYSEMFAFPSIVLIDDIGEGLDFERSTGLIRTLVKLADNPDIQLLMTTNDRFVMNSVPLKHWNVLMRNAGVCTVLNEQNSKEVFERFKLTGLNNFDFFTSEYFNLLQDE